MIGILYLIIAAGLLAILYGYIVAKQILSASPGNKKNAANRKCHSGGCKSLFKPSI